MGRGPTPVLAVPAAVTGWHGWGSSAAGIGCSQFRKLEGLDQGGTWSVRASSRYSLLEVGRELSRPCPWALVPS